MAEIIFKGIAHVGAFKDLFSKNIEDADILDVLTELGMVKSPVKSEQRAKALSPMEITELGILIDVSSETDLNASLPMVVTVLGYHSAFASSKQHVGARFDHGIAVVS